MPYRIITGGTDGVFLFFRLVHIAISGAVSIVWYKTFSECCKMGACLSAVMYLSYARASIDGINYYKVSITCLVLIIVLLVRLVSLREQKGITYYALEVFMGVCIAYEVLSMPFMVVGILAVGVYFIISYKIDLKTIWKDLLRVMAGIAIVAIAFCQWAISWKLYEALRNIGHLFSEPGHSRGLIGTIYDGLFTIYAYGKLIPILLGVLSILLLVGNKLLCRFDENIIVLQLFALILIVDYIYLIYRNCFVAEEGFECFDIIFCAIPILWRSIGKKNILGERITIILGIALALAYFIGSNTGLSASCNGGIIITMGLLIYIPKEIDLREIGTGIKYLILIEMAAIVVLTVFKHGTFVYRDSEIKKLTVEIKEGPYKGLYTSPKQAEEINDIMETVRALNDIKNSGEDNQRIIVSRKIPWIYIAVESGCGSPTVWDVPMDDERINEWNEQKPDKTPDKLILVSSDVGGTQFNYQEFVEMPCWKLLEDEKISNDTVKVYNILY